MFRIFSLDFFVVVGVGYGEVLIGFFCLILFCLMDFVGRDICEAFFSWCVSFRRVTGNSGFVGSCHNNRQPHSFVMHFYLLYPQSTILMRYLKMLYGLSYFISLVLLVFFLQQDGLVVDLFLEKPFAMFIAKTQRIVYLPKHLVPADSEGLFIMG